MSYKSKSSSHVSYLRSLETDIRIAQDLFRGSKSKNRVANFWQSLNKLAETPWFYRLYLALSLVVLAGSTFLWAWLGVRIQNVNADQIVPAYMFGSTHDLLNADVPAAHTFLLKWPLFYLVHLFGSVQSGLSTLTIAIVLVTVASFAFVLWRIDRRPVVYATLLLIVSSCLLLVPPVPAPGNLLPVNMAMLATRNVEYIFFIAAFWFVIRYPSLRNWRFYVGAIILSLLIASDKLFLSLTLGGALLALVAYAAFKGWKLTSFSVRWLLVSLGAALVASAATALLQALHVTHVIGGSSGPYSFVDSIHDGLLGVLYAVTGMLTQFGANPATGTTLLARMPHEAIRSLLGLSGLAHIINLVVFVASLLYALRLLKISIQHNKGHIESLNRGDHIGLALVWSTVASVASFVGTTHYYAGDARYLAITFFALIISLALGLRRRGISSGKLVLVGGVTLIGLLLAIPAVLSTYHVDQSATVQNTNRNESIVRALKRHPNTVLVGDYWRVVPAKAAAGASLSIMPMQNCTTARNVLTQNDWNHDLNKTRFAYLLSFDGSPTDYPHCSLKEVVQTYGRPNASVVIAGALASPKEMLLFYDHGAHKSEPAGLATPAVSTVTPTQINDYPYKVCNGPTVMNVVAHEDDDLLFMNPDELSDIQNGHCVRTVYMTAGDGGNNSFYWLGRMQGSEAAYDKMLGHHNIWVERVVQITPRQLVTIANPRGNANISLVFFYLPDGNMKGQGFVDTGYQSLEKLDNGSIQRINAIYGESKYTKPELIAALTNLMNVFHPTELRTQSNYSGTQFIDHSDHRVVGRLATTAFDTYNQTQFAGKVKLPVTYYLGYPTHQFPATLSPESRDQKERIFMEYSNFDGAVCHNLAVCQHDPAYGAYLTRELTWPY